MIGPILLGLVAGVLISAYFSGMETGYYSVNKLRMTLRARAGDRGFRRVERHLGRSAWLITVILLGNNMANYAASWCGEAFFHRALGEPSEAILVGLNTLLLTPLLFLAGEVLPKAWFRAGAERLTPPLSLGISLAGRLLWPLVMLFRGPAALAERMSRAGGAAPGMSLGTGFKSLLSGGGTLAPVQEELAGRITDLHRIEVGRVMVRLRDVSVLPEEMSREEVLPRAEERPFLRFPVHAQGDPARIVGYVHLLELLFDPRPEVRVRDHLRRLDHFDHRMPVDQALVLLQRAHSRMALVVNPQGAGLGIVTAGDLATRIMGILPGGASPGGRGKK